MKFGITPKTRLLLLLIMFIATFVGTTVLFFTSGDTDGFKIFGRGFMILFSLVFSIDYFVMYMRFSKNLKSD
ncbi:MAG: hypothetical protein ABIP68_03530 [Ferruginibacter sp.]